MFEISECIVLARQMGETLAGKVIVTGGLGNSPHKFVWYNRKPDEFAALVKGKRVREARAKGRWILIPLEPGYVLVFGECGGRILFHVAGQDLPPKYHLSLKFADGSALSATTAMWGAMELYEQGRERERQYLKDMRLTPVEPGFTDAYLTKLIAERVAAGGTSVKGLLTQEQLIPGLGNAIAQDILWKAELHPRHHIAALSPQQVGCLHAAIVETVEEIIRFGGRNDEVDLYGHPGGYARIMDRTAAGRPCPRCGTLVEKITYLGGACYFCPHCQPARSRPP
jgi:formamidopyrimidine-DNA glycosylase